MHGSQLIKVCLQPSLWLIRLVLNSGYHCVKQLGVSLVHCRYIIPQHFFPNNSLVPIYIPGWREVLWKESVFSYTIFLWRFCPQSTGDKAYFTHNKDHDQILRPVMKITKITKSLATSQLKLLRSKIWWFSSLACGLRLTHKFISH